MTLIVVTDKAVYVDSLANNTMGSYIVDKRIQFSHGDEKFIAAGAGSVDEIEHVIAGIMRDGLEFIRDSQCKHNTEVFIRRLSDGALFVVRSHKEARPAPYFFNVVRAPQEAAGSGYHHFWAYFQEHGDTEEAFKLVCTHCESVGFPIQTF